MSETTHTPAELEDAWMTALDLYDLENERSDRLKKALEVCAQHFDEIGETRMAKYARARAASA